MKQHATNIVRELRERGFQAYFAGGCVRDTLLGVEPAAQFGVVLVPSADAPPSDAPPSEHPNYVEVATFRNDGTYSDGRHPDQVSYAKEPQEDVQRRDFTINGLLMDPLDGNRVLDFVGGREDLRE